MTDETPKPPSPPMDPAAPPASPSEGPSEESLGSDPDVSQQFHHLRTLLQHTEVPPPKLDVVRGVQRRLRVRSKGKFYSDGWSTREDNPRTSMLVTALVMLALLIILYLALAPSHIGSLLLG